MNRLLKLVPNVPVEIALSCTDGINVVSPRGTPAVRYTLVDGRTFFATAYVAAKFKKLKIEASERIALCMRIIDGKNITVVERVSQSGLEQENTPVADTDLVDANDTAVSPLPEVENCGSPIVDDPALQPGDAEIPSGDPPLIASEILPPTISQLERALKTAIRAAYSAEQYGSEIGYVVRFDQESIKCMAVTVLIGMQGGRS